MKSISDHPVYLSALKYRDVVKREMQGRLGDPDRDTAAIAAFFSALSGRGDHCEIGVLWGGSAITSALTRREYGVHGKVYCIDPLDGYYMDHPVHARSNDDLLVPISEETLVTNAQHFGVMDDLVIVKSRSHPWPDSLAFNNFSSAFIDGNHWGMDPLNDWINLRNRTSGYIMFDNCEPQYPDVVAAVHAASFHPRWAEYYRNQDVVVFERKL